MIKAGRVRLYVYAADCCELSSALTRWCLVVESSSSIVQAEVRALAAVTIDVWSSTESTINRHGSDYADASLLIVIVKGRVPLIQCGPLREVCI